MLRSTLMLLLTIFLCGTISAGKITFDDLYSIPSYDSPRISPDGTQIVFALTITDLEKNSRVRGYSRTATVIAAIAPRRQNYSVVCFSDCGYNIRVTLSTRS